MYPNFIPSATVREQMRLHDARLTHILNEVLQPHPPLQPLIRPIEAKCPNCGQHLMRIDREDRVIVYCAVANNKCNGPRSNVANDGAEGGDELEAVANLVNKVFSTEQHEQPEHEID